MIYYATPPRRIGRHEWRMIVYDHERFERCTGYQWRTPADPIPPIIEHHWRDEKEWPTYDSNRGDYGHPKSIARIYYDHERAIQAALHPEAATT